MRVNGKPFRTIWVADDGRSVEIIDQTLLPHRFEIARLTTLEATVAAIRDMRVRGAPLIGATAAYGICLALGVDAGQHSLDRACQALLATRPTAINLGWAIEDMRRHLVPLAPAERVAAAYARAAEICEEDVALCRAIGENGLRLFEDLYRRKSQSGQAGPLNVLTHCNAGWLATLDWGTALAPVYLAHDAGLPIHVWVDETRPRNQGAALTAWELAQHGVPHTLIVDNAGGHLMQRGRVDVMITGADRVTAGGDVCNKIGTYLKALAAADNGVPFYAAVPFPTIDWAISDGVRQIPIEERDGREVSHLAGVDAAGVLHRVRITPEGAALANYAFDVTPARLVTGLVTERGIAEASPAGLRALYPERREGQVADGAGQS